ncbi:uncharacterized protein M421DRAFT_92635 [Didymella exigua CBS 183.55]|uniref:Uncharacterized protein n=1 Tax=Didymella exigua CBS 183.55 TaxID=1150837 RepID=A0A6A5RSA1_9PLEO|nr:uncharacterized protein M421DRAFT_92635 [Didymella exigua CBS 183.55]KAF1928377.1 hypothetical protein M421DRAFT_92635 [Didymella exigua CBS 183.55]
MPQQEAPPPPYTLLAPLEPLQYHPRRFFRCHIQHHNLGQITVTVSARVYKHTGAQKIAFDDMLQAVFGSNDIVGCPHTKAFSKSTSRYPFGRLEALFLWIRFCRNRIPPSADDYTESKRNFGCVDNRCDMVGWFTRDKDTNDVYLHIKRHWDYALDREGMGWVMRAERRARADAGLKTTDVDGNTTFEFAYRLQGRSL